MGMDIMTTTQSVSSPHPFTLKFDPQCIVIPPDVAEKLTRCTQVLLLQCICSMTVLLNPSYVLELLTKLELMVLLIFYL